MDIHVPTWLLIVWDKFLFVLEFAPLTTICWAALIYIKRCRTMPSFYSMVAAVLFLYAILLFTLCLVCFSLKLIHPETSFSASIRDDYILIGAIFGFVALILALVVMFTSQLLGKGVSLIEEKKPKVKTTVTETRTETETVE